MKQEKPLVSPSTRVSIVVPAGAGGNTDLSARVFAQYAKEITVHDFIVVNSNGVVGSVAANQVLFFLLLTVIPSFTVYNW